MNRRKFLAGSLAVGTATVAVSASARSPGSNASDKPVQSASTSAKPADWRMKYPVTREEKTAGTIVHDLTYPSGDPRRYEKPGKAQVRARHPDFF